MALIILIAVMAIAVLHAYTRMEATDPERLRQTVKVVRQVAGVLAALAKAIFDVLTAMQGRTAPTSSTGSTSTVEDLLRRAPRVVSALAGPHG